MAGKVIGRKMNIGFIGTMSRSSDNVVVNRVAKEQISFGDVVVLNEDNTVSPFNFSGDEAQNIIGIAVRIIKQEMNISGQVAYLPDEAVDILSRGSITVLSDGAKLVAGGPVYIYSSDNGFVFTGDSINEKATLISNMVFTTGIVDGNKTAEVTILERKA